MADPTRAALAERLETLRERLRGVAFKDGPTHIPFTDPELKSFIASLQAAAALLREPEPSGDEGCPCCDHGAPDDECTCVVVIPPLPARKEPTERGLFVCNDMESQLRDAVEAWRKWQLEATAFAQALGLQADESRFACQRVEEIRAAALAAFKATR